MSVRKPTSDLPASEVARRRLELLGAELAEHATTRSGEPLAPTGSPPTGSPPAGSPPAGSPPAADADAGGRHARQRSSGLGRASERVGDALPPSLQGRLGLTAQHVTVVALVLAAAMALAAWLVIRSKPEVVSPPRQASLQLPVAAEPPAAAAPSVAAASPVAPVDPAAPPGPAATPSVPAVAPVAPAASAPSGAVSAPVVVVHVSGKVRTPGVVTLPGGSRVVDALEAAGGARPRVPLGSLNLARPVVDGEQIAVGVSATSAVPGVVGGPPPAAPAPAAPAPAVPTAGVAPTPGVPGMPVGLVNLNTATQLELEELPGVGPVTATSIIAWRTEYGGFSTVDELLEVSGIGEITLGELRDLVTV